MSHHVHPYAHRLGTLRDWKSRWFADNGRYQEYLKGDTMLRGFLEKRLRGMMTRYQNTLIAAPGRS